MTVNRRFMPTGRNATAVLALLATAGCGPDTPATSDCQAQVSTDGATYTSYGDTERSAVQYGSAERAECRDNGDESTGNLFTDDAESVTTWTFDGYDPLMVLGVRYNADTFAVFVADDVPEAEQKRIYRDLR